MILKSVSHRFTIDGFYSAFRFSWDENFVFEGESHDLWEVVFITAGEVVSTEEGKVYVLRANDMILHAPMEFHRIRSAKGSSPEGVILTFHATGTLPSELKKGIFALDESEKAEYRTIATRIIEFMESDDRDEFSGQAVANLLSAFLIRLGSETAESRLDNRASAVEYRRVVSAMTTAVAENLTLTDFAERCNISISYIKQLFRRYAGVSPKTYYAHLRVRHAADLLGEGRTAAEVAEAMNFSSPGYFSVFFKKHTGKVPSEFRRNEM